MKNFLEEYFVTGTRSNLFTLEQYIAGYSKTVAFNPIIHHRRSIRLKGYDYSCAGLYFITICVQDRRCLFGGIENDK